MKPNNFVEQFLQSANTGDVEGLLAVLDEDVTWLSDGGGAPGVAQKPIHGAGNVTRFVLNLVRQAPENVTTRPAELNGGPGLIIYVGGRPFTALSFHFAGGRIKGIYAVANPDKLRTIPPLEPTERFKIP